MDGEFYSKTICLLSTRPPPPSSLLPPDHLAVQEAVPCQRGEAGGAAEAGAQEFTVSRGQTWPSLETCRQPRETIWTALFLSSSHLIYGTELEWNIVWNGRKYLKQPPESHSNRGDAISLDADSLSLYFRYINSAQVNWHTTCHIRRGEVPDVMFSLLTLLTAGYLQHQIKTLMMTFLSEIIFSSS